MFVIESEFIAEVIDPVTLAPLPDGKPGELVLTNLGRLGSPLIRYRTGDQVVLRRDSPPAGRRPHARRMRCTFARAVGGVLGRVDDMLIIRGNNIYPAAIEGLLHGVPEVAEFRYEVATCRAMAELKLVIEPRPDADPAALPQRVVAAFRERFNLRPIVELVAPGGLPRFELKARRRIERGSEKRA